MAGAVAAAVSAGDRASQSGVSSTMGLVVGNSAASSSTAPAPRGSCESDALARESDLHRAVAEGDALVVLRLLAAGANPNAEDMVFGEPPLFEAAVSDASSVVVLLLLFSADATRCRRHSSTTAASFAPAGGTTAQLLEAVVCGNSSKARTLSGVALGPVVEALGASSNRSREAVMLNWRLKSVGHPGIPWCAASEVNNQANLGMPIEELFPPEVCGGTEGHAASGPPMDVSELADQTLHRETSRARLSKLMARLSAQRTALSPPCSAEALLVLSMAMATVAACVPKEALSVLPAVSGAFAELLLNELDDSAWKHAVSEVAPDVVAHDRRRRGVLDGTLLSWKDTFQEATTQQLYSWGVDGIVTGFGSRAPQKSYSRPSVLVVDRPAGHGEGGRVLARAIRCGRRHSALSCFSEGVFVWGRDVVPPTPSQEEVIIGFLRRTRSRAMAWDRPQLLAEPPPPSPPAPPATPPASPTAGANEGSAPVEGNGGGGGSSMPRPAAAPPPVLTPQLADTLLQLAGGWVQPETSAPTPPRDVGPPPERDAPERGAEPLAPVPSSLPPLRKLVRSVSFNVAMTLDGRCFVWRDPGLLAIDMALRVGTEPRALLPPEELAVDVAVGEGHLAVLTERGRVWTFGWRHRSALGRGPRPVTEAAGVAAPVPGLERIVQIGAGATYTLALDALGVIWLFGEGPCIIGCFNDPLALHEPRRVPSSTFGGRRVLAASCGEGHVLVLTAWDPCCRLPQPGAWYNVTPRSKSAVEGDAVLQDTV